MDIDKLKVSLPPEVIEQMTTFENRITELEANGGRLRDRIGAIERKIMQEFQIHVVAALKDAIKRGETFMGKFL